MTIFKCKSSVESGDDFSAFFLGFDCGHLWALNSGCSRLYMVQVRGKHLVVVVHKKFYNLPNWSQLMRMLRMCTGTFGNPFLETYGEFKTMPHAHKILAKRCKEKLWVSSSNLHWPPCWSRSGTSEVKLAEASCGGPGVISKEHQSNKLFCIKFYLFF